MSVIGRTSLGDEYVRVQDSGLVAAVAQFLYDEAALLDDWRLDEWLAPFHPDAEYLIPSPEDLSDDRGTTLHLVHDSMATLSGRVVRLKSKHAHAESPCSRTRRQIANVCVWQGPDDDRDEAAVQRRLRHDRRHGVAVELERPRPPDGNHLDSQDPGV